MIDNLRDVSPSMRLIAQAVAVGLALAALGDDQLVFQGALSFSLDRTATAICWLWLINIFNFMDGIDGITVVEAIAVGVMAVVVLADLPIVQVYLAAVLIGAMAGFAPFNWYPRRSSWETWELSRSDSSQVGCCSTSRWMDSGPPP